MAKKVTRILFNVNFYDRGEVKYAAGKHYPVTAQTQSCVLAGSAEEVQVDMPAEQAAAETEAAVTALAAERGSSATAEAAAARGGDAGTQNAEGSGI